MRKSGSPAGLEVIQSCLSCAVREEGLFCQLGAESLAKLDSIRQTKVCPKGAVLFSGGQPARGLYIVCSGRAKLSITSPQYRSMIVGVAGPGDVLGLSAVISGAPYDVSVTALELTQVNFLARDDFLRFLQEHGEVAVQVARCLSVELRRAHQQAARLALAPSARAKLAGLLLEWARDDPKNPGGGLQFELRLTHEEVGELIGISRETVARLLNEFRRKALIQTCGTTVTVPERSRLEAVLG